MLLKIRIHTRELFGQIRDTFRSLPVELVLEENRAFSAASCSDAEYLSIGIAERFGAVPHAKPNSAYIIKTNPGEAPFPAPFVVTGVWMTKIPTPKKEVMIALEASRAAVDMHNRRSSRQIHVIGMSADYLNLSDISLLELRDIIYDLRLSS